MNNEHVIKTISVYDKTAEKYAEQTEKRVPEIERQYFIQSIPERGKILDVGCGSGRDVKEFCDHGFIVTGIDLSGKMLAIAGQKAPDATFIQQDLRHLSFSQNSFDGIWACTSLLHIKHEELGNVLKTLFSILKPNGTIGIIIKAGVGERFISAQSLPDEKRFFSFYSKPMFKKALETAGFTITKLYAYNDKDRYPWLKSEWLIAAFATKQL